MPVTFLLRFPLFIVILLLDNANKRKLSDNKFLKMDQKKAQFKRLIELMGWSQTEAARWLHKTPSAINHLVNPGHPNKPTQTTLLLLKLIIARERPDFIKAQTCELKEAPTGAKPDATRLNSRELGLIQSMRQLPPGEREKAYAVMRALLRAIRHNGGKPIG